MAEEQAKLTIDGTEYNIADLTEEAKAQVQNIKVTEAEMKHLGIKTAIAQTARNAYVQALKSTLPKN